MVKSAVQFNLEDKTLSGYVTDVLHHDDGSISYEILADGRCHYLKESQFKVMSRSASLRQDIPQYAGPATLKHDLDNIIKRAPTGLRDDLEQVIGKHF